jgi:lipopolysaccharide transport system ATP-binding protein
MNSVIQAKNISKSYQLGQQRQQGYLTLRETLVEGARALAAGLTRPFTGATRGPGGKPGGDPGEFWALKELSFQINAGDRVGIIGRNGAGKSTLLKILSRITEPSAGEVRIKGRVASLLEVGTGFHPELTGRENIFLNGAILGMSRGEIRKKFDEIVDFAEVERFLDTPVKRYSSGMYVRLAFAVAAHLEPEILIVDEVLAVGDAEFQKKCLGKLGEVGDQGRTVLFVSHNMAAINRLCTRAMVLHEGQCLYDGETGQAIGRYLKTGAAQCTGYADLREAPGWTPDRRVIMTWVSTHRSDGTETADFFTGDDLSIRVGFRMDAALPAYCQINILNFMGDRLITLRSTHSCPAPLELSGMNVIECSLSDLRLLPGEYIVMLEIGRQFPQSEWLDCVPEAIRIRVHLGDYLGGFELAPGQGVLAQRSRWRVALTGDRTPAP